LDSIILPTLRGGLFYLKEQQMSKADDDAAKWMEMNSKVQYRNLIKAKELGDLYYINANGDVVIHDPSKPIEEKTTLNK
jgi:hypothetical protein